jgi:hypothetical protein
VGARLASPLAVAAPISSQFTHRRTNSRSNRPSSSSTFANPSSSAASVPGRGATQKSLIDAVFESRVSMVASFAPAILPSMIRCACGLK